MYKHLSIVFSLSIIVSQFASAQLPPQSSQVYPRTSRYIWHTLFGELGCPDGKGKAYVSLLGSKFPTHRVWVDGELRDTKDQGRLRDLWTPHPQDSTRVW